MISINALQRQRLATLPLQYSICCTRPFSTPPAFRDAHPPPTKQKLHNIDPRWLTTTKKRLGKCMMFGMKPSKIQEAGTILHRIARDWRELIAGSEGYLTDATRRGLFQQTVAWGEQDFFVLVTGCHGHVNNVTYVRYAETARVYFTRNYAIHVDPAHKKEWLDLVSSNGIGVILRSIKIDYKFPMTYPDKVTVYHKLAHDPASPHAPKDAFDLQVVIISESRQRPAARCHEDLVTYDYKQGKKTALPPFLMDQFKATWELQEKNKTFWRQQILDIEDKVRTLEVESWDREDAVEDTGSATQ